MAAVVGRPIKVDKTTLNVARGRFARVCVEIDLDVPVVGKIWLQDHWYKVEYESLHLICGSCGHYGHVTRSCSKKPQEESSQNVHTGEGNLSAALDKDKTPSGDMEVAISAPTQENLHGEWLVVSKVKRNRNKAQGKGASGSGIQNKDVLPPKNLVTPVDTQNIQGSQSSGQIVFQSKALPQPNSPNARKKRHRTEPPPKVLNSSETKSPLNSSKVPSVEAVGTSLQPYGIKTMMNVEVLSNNRLRFRDEDDPGGSPSSKYVAKDKAMDSKDQGMTSKSDAGMEASIASKQ